MKKVLNFAVKCFYTLSLIFFFCKSYAENNLVTITEKSDLEAQYSAALHYDSIGDYESAYKLFKKAAQQKDRRSIGQLAIYNMGGKGFEINRNNGEKLFLTAAILGDNTSVDYIAKIYMQKDRANDWFFDAYAICLIHNNCTKPVLNDLLNFLYPVEIELAKDWKNIVTADYAFDIDTTLEKIKPATPGDIADKGYKLYYNNNIEESKKYFAEAFSQGHVDSGYMLALISNNWNDYYKSAQKGAPQSQMYVGSAYLSSGDMDNGIKWIKKAALQGDIDAQSRLGTIFRDKIDKDTIGWISNAAKSYRSLPMLQLAVSMRKSNTPGWFELFEYSAIKGNIFAMRGLGAYYYSVGNMKKAFTTYEIASRLRDYMSCLVMSDFLHATDPIKAYEYYLIANTIDPKGTKEFNPGLLKKILKQLNNDNIKVAEQNSKLWLAKNIRGGYTKVLSNSINNTDYVMTKKLINKGISVTYDDLINMIFASVTDINYIEIVKQQAKKIELNKSNNQPYTLVAVATAFFMTKDDRYLELISYLINIGANVDAIVRKNILEEDIIVNGKIVNDDKVLRKMIIKHIGD